MTKFEYITQYTDKLTPYTFGHNNTSINYIISLLDSGSILKHKTCLGGGGTCQGLWHNKSL